MARPRTIKEATRALTIRVVQSDFELLQDYCIENDINPTDLVRAAIKSVLKGDLIYKKEESLILKD